MSSSRRSSRISDSIPKARPHVEDSQRRSRGLIASGRAAPGRCSFGALEHRAPWPAEAQALNAELYVTTSG
eukprot:CAMPEP_0117469814 /NCGR_PEP_ID=MMETSP0784-20121206/6892_1 /TAXON_ID=39447 /ORGANISM="" /LENGTH=70 /DNA_ID=CAMNT_0005263879 /DNA_START=359 /DNA_END=567 /DNA_ORIENTATION=+